MVELRAYEGEETKLIALAEKIRALHTRRKQLQNTNVDTLMVKDMANQIAVSFKKICSIYLSTLPKAGSSRRHPPLFLILRSPLHPCLYMRFCV